MGLSGTQIHKGLRAWSLTAMALASCYAAPASASPEPNAKLVRCGAESCLRISGQRDGAGAIVMINGNAVATEGDSKWQVLLPVDTVREWSAPHARTVDIVLFNPEDGQATHIAVVDLPIGLLGGVNNLDSMVVSAL